MDIGLSRTFFTVGYYYTMKFLENYNTRKKKTDNIIILSLVCALVHLLMHLVGQEDSLMDFRLQVVSKLRYRIYIPRIKSSRALQAFEGGLVRGKRNCLMQS